MRRTATLVALIGMVATLAAGCSGPSRVPGIGGTTPPNGTIVVHVVRSSEVANLPLRRFFALFVSPARANEPLTVLLTVSKSEPGGPSVRYTESKPYQPGGISLMLDVPEGTEYVAAALLVDKNRHLRELGVHWNLRIKANDTTVTDVTVGPPTYSYDVPASMRSADLLSTLHGDSSHSMIGDDNVSILIGPMQWAEDGPPRYGSGFVKADILQQSFRDVWPNLEYPHTFYWQVQVCAQPRFGPSADDLICLYKPSLASDQFLNMLTVGP